jgi:SpoVK/Ycf46/Vps4 family AAA+-type ATPase
LTGSQHFSPHIKERSYDGPNKNINDNENEEINNENKLVKNNDIISIDKQLQSSLSSEIFKPPKGLLLHGPSGTGKPKLMRLIANLIS